MVPRNECYNSYSFALQFYHEVSVTWCNHFWTGSVQNVEQKALLVPEVTNQCSISGIIESCGPWFVFHSPGQGEHHNRSQVHTASRPRKAPFHFPPSPPSPQEETMGPKARRKLQHALSCSGFSPARVLGWRRLGLRLGLSLGLGTTMHNPCITTVLLEIP